MHSAVNGELRREVGGGQVKQYWLEEERLAEREGTIISHHHWTNSPNTIDELGQSVGGWWTWAIPHQTWAWLRHREELSMIDDDHDDDDADTDWPTTTYCTYNKPQTEYTAYNQQQLMTPSPKQRRWRHTTTYQSLSTDSRIRFTFAHPRLVAAGHGIQSRKAAYHQRKMYRVRIKLRRDMLRSRTPTLSCCPLNAYAYVEILLHRQGEKRKMKYQSILETLHVQGLLTLVFCIRVKQGHYLCVKSTRIKQYRTTQCSYIEARALWLAVTISNVVNNSAHSECMQPKHIKTMMIMAIKIIIRIAIIVIICIRI